MKRIALLLALATPLFAATNDSCRDFMRLGALYEVRSILLRPNASSYDVNDFIDKQLAHMREGWIRWVRPERDAPIDKHIHTVAAVNGATTDSFEASGTRAFQVKVVVPSKRSLFNKNAPVYVGKVGITYDVDGHPHTKTQTIDAWMNPDTSRTIDLEAIADRVDAALEASTNAKDAKQSIVEIHFVQAVPRDDPNNPAYDAIQSLARVRDNSDANTIDDEIARAERELFPSAEPIPVTSIIADLRHADELMHSKKDADVDQGQRLLKETLRRLR
jgi:hypothetical protein